MDFPSLAASEAGASVDVEPLCGRLILFDSRMEHEVLTSHHERYACTVWLRAEEPAEHIGTLSLIELDA